MEKKRSSLFFYIISWLIFGSLMYFMIRQGADLQNMRTTEQTVHVSHNLYDGFQVFTELLTKHIQSPIGLILLQIIIILITCRLTGWLFSRMGQPTVIGEIMAGIILGPSVLGHFAPEVSLAIFPEESLPNINIISQFGLILFMYAIGMGLSVDEVRKKIKNSLIISHISMMFPFGLGVITAYFIYTKYSYENTQFLPFALFIGIALSISAFPVLARIIQEKGLTRTNLGTTTLASAACDNISAWYILAIIVAIAQAGSMLGAIYNIFFSILYMAVMFGIVRPLLKMKGLLYHNKEVIDKVLVMVMFMILIISSYLTEILGLHALFGAFIAGMVMPENTRFRKIITEKVEDVSLALFLPLFFASTGLRTQIGLLNTNDLWILCAIFILIAIVGKVGGAVFAARIVKENWKNSLFIGGLMNTRGLMELIVLTIGYDLHILPPTIFVILVLMTLVTTFMTTPLLSFISLCFRTGERISLARQDRRKTGVFKVLLSFGRAGNGQIMLDVAHQMFSQGKDRLELTALHLTVGADVNPLHTDNFERISFGPVLYEARKLNMRIHTRYEIATNAEQNIVQIANEEPYDFLLVGSGVSLSNLESDVHARKIQKAFSRLFKIIKTPEFLISPGSLLHDKTKWFIEHSHCPVGVFINRQFVKATHILIIIQSINDLFLFDYANTLVAATKGTVSVLNRISYVSSENEQVLETINNFIVKIEDALILPEKDLMNESFNGHDFMLISYPAWNILSEECSEALKEMPSTLIINHKEPKI